MSGRALTYVTVFFGTDSDSEVRKSTLWTPYWESIGSLFYGLDFRMRMQPFLTKRIDTQHFRLLRIVALASIEQDNSFEVISCLKRS